MNYSLSALTEAIGIPFGIGVGSNMYGVPLSVGFKEIQVVPEFTVGFVNNNVLEEIPIATAVTVPYNEPFYSEIVTGKDGKEYEVYSTDKGLSEIKQAMKKLDRNGVDTDTDVYDTESKGKEYVPKNQSDNAQNKNDSQKSKIYREDDSREVIGNESDKKIRDMENKLKELERKSEKLSEGIEGGGTEEENDYILTEDDEKDLGVEYTDYESYETDGEDEGYKEDMEDDLMGGSRIIVEENNRKYIGSGVLLICNDNGESKIVLVKTRALENVGNKKNEAGYWSDFGGNFDESTEKLAGEYLNINAEKHLEEMSLGLFSRTRVNLNNSKSVVKIDVKVNGDDCYYRIYCVHVHDIPNIPRHNLRGLFNANKSQIEKTKTTNPILTHPNDLELIPFKYVLETNTVKSDDGVEIEYFNYDGKRYAINPKTIACIRKLFELKDDIRKNYVSYGVSLTAVIQQKLKYLPEINLSTMIIAQPNPNSGRKVMNLMRPETMNYSMRLPTHVPLFNIQI